MLTRILLVGLCLLIIMPFAALADGTKLAAGDMIAISVDSEKEFSKPYQINNDGCILMPMIKPVKIVGLNTSAAAAAIAKALQVVLVNPQVTVGFIEKAKMQVFVVGQVKKSGPIDVGSGDKVIQALSQAGYDDTADLTRVTIHRQDQVIPLDLTKYLKGEDLNVNVDLQSGDTVVVSRSDMVGTVQITGRATKPGTLPLTRGMTFREAMGVIGDATVDADTSSITIRREGKAEPIKVDYKKAMSGDPVSDVTLQANDVINIPELETSSFTVMGGVNRPGQFPLAEKITLSQAVGLAGGPMPNIGDLRKVQLMRGETSGKSGETRNIDLTKVMKDASQDPEVQRGDVIYVTPHKEKINILQALQALLPIGWLFK